MNTVEPPGSKDDFLLKLLDVVERIANTGDLQSVQPLLEMTRELPQSPILSSLAEAFARMVVKIEAREFQLECAIEELTTVKGELELANYDNLTGLPNRVIAIDRLRHGIAHARRSSELLAIMYLDLDRFKWVNDNLGHPAGDELLRQVAERLLHSVRDTDTMARLGGDEFLCVLPELHNSEPVHHLAERFVATLALPFNLAAGEVSIGVSIGVAIFPEHAASIDLLMACADKALYRAKNAGRNGYAIFSADMT